MTGKAFYKHTAFAALMAGVLAMLTLTGCAPSLSGRVVNPDGSALSETGVKVYTAPRTATAHASRNGEFKISDNVAAAQEYTLIAEDPEGNMGYVRDFLSRKGSNEGIVIRMSREMDAKDAVLEGTGPSEIERNGAGEKILKSSP